MRAMLRADAPTLRDFIALVPEAFYAQTWYTHELFVHVAATTLEPRTPPTHAFAWRGDETARVQAHDDDHAAPCDYLPRAVDLTWAYLAAPDAPVWRGWLWCADTDDEGQRVFVGNPNGRGWEIHRHLRMSDRWRVAYWTAAPSPSPEV